MADLRSGIVDAAPPPPGVQILSISCSLGEIWQIGMLAPPRRVGAPSSRKSWIPPLHSFHDPLSGVQSTTFLVLFFFHFHAVFSRRIQKGDEWGKNPPSRPVKRWLLDTLLVFDICRPLGSQLDSRTVPESRHLWELKPDRDLDLDWAIH